MAKIKSRKPEVKKSHSLPVANERLEWIRLQALARRQQASAEFWLAFHGIVKAGVPAILEGHLDQAKALMRLHHLFF